MINLHYKKLLTSLILSTFLVGGILTPLSAAPSVGDSIYVEGVRYSPGSEVIELRDQYSQTTYNGGGELTKRTFLGSIHYEDADGNFQEIDTAIIPSSRPNWDWEVTTGHWQLFIRNDTTVGIKKGDNWVGTRLHGIAYLDIVTKDYTILQTTNTVIPVVSGNEIRWNNILYGVDLVLRYTNDSFKEEIVVKQEARDLLNSPGYRPSDYGYVAQDTYLVPIFEADWSQSLPMKFSSGQTLNPDEAETNGVIYFESPIEDPYWGTNLINFFPVDSVVSANPTNPEDPEEDWVYASEVLKKRLVKRNDKHWLLIGASVVTLNQMPEGSLIFDPTETLRPNAAGDECNIPGYAGADCPNHWQNVDEETHDGSTTQVNSTLDAWSRDLYNIGNSGISTGTINKVTVFAYAHYGSGTVTQPSLVIAIKTGGTAYEGSEETLTTSYDLYSKEWTVNPDTSNPWSWAEIDALQAGIKIRKAHSLSGKITRVTQVYVEVDYTLVVLPTVTTQAVSSITDITATGNGNITDTGGENADKRGIVYDTSSHGDPGDVAPPATYSSYEEETDSFGTGAFTRSLTGLTPGQIYYARAYAHNSEGYSYGGEVSFYTLPSDPSVLSATTISDTQIDLTWTKGAGGDKTMVRRKEGSYPTGPSDGDQVYFDTGANYSDVGRDPATLYYYRAWAYDTDSGDYSSGYSSDTATTYGPPSVTTNTASLVEETTATLNGEITVTNGANATIRGFEWDVDSGSPYAYDWNESGDFGVEAFNRAISSLTKGELYYYRAYATNTYGTDYGSEGVFITKPDEPNTLVATPDTVQIDFTWVKGTGAQNTYIRGKDGSYPTDRDDGYLVYNDTGTATSDAGLTGGHTYYYKAWSYATEGGEEEYSDAYDFAFATPGLSLELWFQPVTIITNTGEEGTVDSGSTITLVDAILTQTDDYWNLARLIITDTTDDLAPKGETAVITDFTAVDDTLHFVALTAAVGAGDTYTVDFGTLPDRGIASNDARITWGVMPTGVGVAMGSLVSDAQPVPGLVVEDETTDILPAVEVSDWFGEPGVGDTLLVNPLRPIVTLMSDTTTITELQAWRLLALAFILFVTVSVLWAVKGHLLITGIAAGAAIGLAVAWTIFPMWALVFVVMAVVGGLVAERSPSL